jgi:PrtD family type I secretion system ABC transporter
LWAKLREGGVEKRLLFGCQRTVTFRRYPSSSFHIPRLSTAARRPPALARITVFERNFNRLEVSVNPEKLSNASRKSELGQALLACRRAFVAFGVFSAVLNVLALTGSLFMLEVYDRVLPSRSVPTLIGLLSLVVVLYLFQGLLDAIRGRLLSRIGMRLDLSLTERVYRLIVRLPLQAPRGGEGIQPVRDLDTIRGYLSGRGPTAFFDLPWLPFYLVICFAFHVWIGVTVLVGAVILIALTVLTEMYSRDRVREATQIGAERTRIAELSRRNAEAITALGMTERLQARWLLANRKYVIGQLRASDVTDGLGSIGRVFRMMLQSVVLAVGAYLVINQQATAGIIIASSILSARALAPVDLAISQWRGLVAARQARLRLEKLLELLPAMPVRTPLPVPSKNLSVENVTVALPQSQRSVIQDVTFTLKSGSGLGVIGPSASGKSSLARALVGLWPAARGSVRLDAAALDQWAPDALGRHIGFLPQNVELIEGSVGENIARFDPDADPGEIVDAAKAAGVHELIVRLPQGYDTPVGEQGRNLSGGQQQRIALARALYGNPFLLVLDEPNSNLDSDGDEALTQAILGVRARGGIVIVIAHRPSALAGVDHVLALSNGRPQAFGAKDEVLSQVLKREAGGTPKVVAVAGGQR